MNRAARRRREREQAKGRTPSGWTEHASPKQLGTGSGWFGEFDKVYTQSGEHAVMTRDIDTAWGLVTHACIRNAAGTDIPWAEKQRIKNEIFGAEQQAVEVFPKESELVDEANMYHLWILPPDMEIPFSLKEKKKEQPEFMETCDDCGKQLDMMKNEDIYLEPLNKVVCGDCWTKEENKRLLRETVQEARG